MSPADCNWGLHKGPRAAGAALGGSGHDELQRDPVHHIGVFVLGGEVQSHRGVAVSERPAGWARAVAGGVLL